MDYVDISPDGETVVYTADTETQGFFHLYSVPIAGPASAGVALSPPGPTGHHVWNPAIAPDGRWVVYQAEVAKAKPAELYTVPIGGPSTEARNLNDAPVSGGEVQYFRITPDSSRVVYWADQDTVDQDELYSVPIEGPSSAIERINHTLFAGEDVKFGFRLSPDSRRVLYEANRFILFLSQNYDNLYTAPIDPAAGTIFRMTGNVLETTEVQSYTYAPDSNHIVYLADQESEGIRDLFVSYWRKTAARAWSIYK